MRDIRNDMTIDELITWLEAVNQKLVPWEDIEPFPSESLYRKIMQARYLMESIWPKIDE